MLTHSWIQFSKTGSLPRPWHSLLFTTGPPPNFQVLSLKQTRQRPCSNRSCFPSSMLSLMVCPKPECPTSFLPVKQKLLNVTSLGFPPDMNPPFSYFISTVLTALFILVSCIDPAVGCGQGLPLSLFYISSSSLCVANKCLLSYIRNFSICALALLVFSCVLLSYLINLSLQFLIKKWGS